MTIVVNLNHFAHSADNDFLDDYFLQTAASKPEHQFIFVSPAAIDSQFIHSENITNIISCPRANNRLMWKIWLDYQLPSLAKKQGANLLLNTGSACSLRSVIPQWLFVSDFSFLHFPAFFSKKELHYLKKKTPQFLRKANQIVVTADALNKEISEHYPAATHKTSVVQLPVNSRYQPLGWKQKELVKEKYTQGKEYFLFSGEIHARNNLVNLLKAFSFFKKRQKSNMQLIITGKAVSKNDPFMEAFKTYKYRDEVTLLTGLPDGALTDITAAAYAFLYPSSYDATALFPLQAMQCEVPVITTATGAITEITGDAALYTDPADFEDIADKMMLVFKDENLRAGLIGRGKPVVDAHRKGTMEEAFWQKL